jgi:hypothetical protein
MNGMSIHVNTCQSDIKTHVINMLKHIKNAWIDVIDSQWHIQAPHEHINRCHWHLNTHQHTSHIHLDATQNMASDQPDTSQILVRHSLDTSCKRISTYCWDSSQASARSQSDVIQVWVQHCSDQSCISEAEQAFTLVHLVSDQYHDLNGI